jgi:hypothetical protein
MTELDPAEKVAADLLAAPAEFDARAHLKGASHAKATVTVYTDGESAWELDQLQKAILDAEAEAKSLSAAGHGGIVDADGYEEAEARVEELKAQEAPLVEKLLLSKQVFHLRGVPTKLLKIIDRKARKEIKPPARKNFASDADGEDEYELEAFERNVARNDLTNYLTVAAAIVKVEDAHGSADTKAWSAEDVEELQGSLYDSEWYKILKGVRDVTSGQHLFSVAVERDADFLSKR